mmetsp:Transcript_80758/g.127218  ORF Transcript_80758/g.127218 Transcript_80758/m.127218 type:complete len:88 (-) Transcript_80758:161-424(-)
MLLVQFGAKATARTCTAGDVWRQRRGTNSFERFSPEGDGAQVVGLGAGYGAARNPERVEEDVSPFSFSHFVWTSWRKNSRVSPDLEP